MRIFGRVLIFIGVVLLIGAGYGYIRVCTSDMSASDIEMIIMLNDFLGERNMTSDFEELLYNIIRYRSSLLIGGFVCFAIGIALQKIGKILDTNNIIKQDKSVWHCPECNCSNPNTNEFCKNCGKKRIKQCLLQKLKNQKKQNTIARIWDNRYKSKWE